MPDAKTRQQAADRIKGRDMILRSNSSRTFSEVLDTDKEVRKNRLALAREGAKALLEGTQALNKLKSRQSTDHNN